MKVSDIKVNIDERIDKIYGGFNLSDLQEENDFRSTLVLKYS